MKIRSDFVTNSSSSSFIIGKKDDSITVESTFQMLKNLYRDYLDRFERLKKECNKFNAHWDEDSKMFKSDKDDRYFFDMDSKVEEEYGISLFEYARDFSWMNFETYAEYENYWLDLLKNLNEDEYKEAPFSIIDYTTPNSRYRIDCGKWCLEEGPESCNAAGNDIFGWYVCCARYFFPIDEEDKEAWADCFDGKYNSCEYCEMAKDHNTCEVYKKLKDSKTLHNITDENAIALILGKICIHSECGRIPDYIVNKLRKMSNYSCNHMG